MKLFRLAVPILAGLAMAAGALTAFARSQVSLPPPPVARDTNLSPVGPPEFTSGAENMHADQYGRLWISQDNDFAPNIRVFDPATNVYTIYGGMESPNDAQLGPDGHAWFIMDIQGWLARLDPATGVVTTWTVPNLGEANLTFADNGPNSDVWILNNSGPGMERFTPNSHQLCSIALPDNAGGSFTGAFVSQHNGAIWGAVVGDAQIGGVARITPTTSAYTVWPANAAGFTPIPSGAAFAPDGTLWFSDEVSGTLGRLEPNANRLTLFLPPAGDLPQKVEYFMGRVWFTGQNATEVTGTLGYLDPATALGTTPIVVTPTTAVLAPVCADAGAGLTFTTTITPGVSAFSPLPLTTTVDAQGIAYHLPISSQPASLVRLGSDLWSTDEGRNKLMELVITQTLYLPLVRR